MKHEMHGKRSHKRKEGEPMKLYPFQKNVLKQVENENHVAFYLDMGLG